MPTRHPIATRARLAAGLVAAILMTVASPALAGSLLDRTRDALQQAGKDITQAAQDAGRDVQDYLVGNPDLNRDLVDFGNRLGLPGFDEKRPSPGATLVAAPSPAAPGVDVRLSAVGLPGAAEVTIAAGPTIEDAKELAKATTNDRGGLATSVAVPEDAMPGEPLLFVVETGDRRVRLVSEPVEVIPAADVVTVTGTLSKEGVTCPALRGDDGALYTLAGGDLSHFGPGDRVTVTGTEAEASICMQGTTLGVISVAVAE
ncbi:MAG: hypothetical protein KDJ86_10365 [Bauldia sp.]|uniref:DUF5818 domain-containing protein n=1 Tax=Bauldia sp. TaxID=2575872 RepID=UPI001E134381|nr:DUF5818 domain-containing protein [Bauldia sp.]MCB1496179.1 hypothetical protein [Bauldia sp.]